MTKKASVTTQPWLRITKNGFCGALIYVGRDPVAARNAMTEPSYMYSCYSGATDDGPWYWLGVDDLRKMGLKAS